MLQTATTKNKYNCTWDHSCYKPEFYLKANFPLVIYAELLFLREGNKDYRYSAIDTFLVLIGKIWYRTSSRLTATETGEPGVTTGDNIEK